MVLPTQKNDPTIEFFFDNTKGEMTVRDTMKYFRGEYHDYLHKYSIHEDRAAIQAGTLKFLCGYCKRPIHICGGLDEGGKRMPLHFRHWEKNVEDCPFEKGERLSKREVEARKYNGARESNEHNDTKLFLARYLRTTLMDGITPSVRVEEVVRRDDSLNYCRPDVFAAWEGKMECAFELQLSTTFLSVIDGRNRFYRSSGRFIMWVFTRFSDVQEYQRLTDIDILVTNNYNAYVLDEAAKRLTGLHGELFVTVHYIVPRITDDSDDIVNDEFQCQTVSIRSLHFRESDHAVYLYDNRQRQEELKAEIDERRRKRIEEENRRREEERKQIIREERKAEIDKIKLSLKHFYYLTDDGRIKVYFNGETRYVCRLNFHARRDVFNLSFYIQLMNLCLKNDTVSDTYFRILRVCLNGRPVGADDFKEMDDNITKSIRACINKKDMKRLGLLFTLRYMMLLCSIGHELISLSYYKFQVILTCTGAYIGMPIGTGLHSMAAVARLFQPPQPRGEFLHLFLKCVKDPSIYKNSKGENVYYALLNSKQTNKNTDLDEVMKFLLPKVNW